MFQFLTKQKINIPNMRTILHYILFIYLFIFCSCNQIYEEQPDVSELSQEVKYLLFQNLILVDDQYQLTISEQQAIEKGISSTNYRAFVQMIKESNQKMILFKEQHSDYKVIFYDPQNATKKMETKSNWMSTSSSIVFKGNESLYTGFSDVAITSNRLDIWVSSNILAGIQAYTFLAYFTDNRSQQFTLVEAGDGNGKPLMYYYDPVFNFDKHIIATCYFDIPNTVGPNGEIPYFEDNKTVPSLGIIITRLSAQDSDEYSTAKAYLYWDSE